MEQQREGEEEESHPATRLYSKSRTGTTTATTPAATTPTTKTTPAATTPAAGVRVTPEKFVLPSVYPEISASAEQQQQQHMDDDNNNNNNNKTSLSARVLLERAREWHHQGVEWGIYGGRVEEAEAALYRSETVLQPILLLQQQHDKNNNNLSYIMAARKRLIRVCISQAELALVLFRYQPVKEWCGKAMQHHQALVELYQIQDNDDDDDDNNTTEQKLVSKTEKETDTTKLSTAAAAAATQSPNQPNTRRTYPDDGTVVSCSCHDDDDHDAEINDADDDNTRPRNIMIQKIHSTIPSNVRKSIRVELNVLQADIYRCLSIVDYRLNDDQHKTWDHEGTRLLERAVALDPHNVAAKSLLALFWSYQITTGDANLQQAVQDSLQAIDWLGEMYEQQQTEQSLLSIHERDLHARRLAVVLRLASYALRDVGRKQEAMEAAQGALQVCQALCRQRPNAVVYLFELYHVQCAMAEHVEAGIWHDADDDDDDDEGAMDRWVLQARQDAALALDQLTRLLPRVPKYWRSLCTTWIDVADLQERIHKGERSFILDTADRALYAAEQCLACGGSGDGEETPTTSGDDDDDDTENGIPIHTTGFEDQVEYARALLERGRHGYIQKQFDGALEFYERALRVYQEHILDHPRAQRSDEFYVELILRSMQAASNCAQAVHRYQKAAFFLEQVHLSVQHQQMKLRKNKLLYASLLVEWAQLMVTRRRRQSQQQQQQNNQAGVGVVETAMGILKDQVLEQIVRPLLKESPWHATLFTLYGDTMLLLAKCYRATGDARQELLHLQKYLEFAAKKHGKDYTYWLAGGNGDEDDDSLVQEVLGSMRQFVEQSVPPIRKYRLPVRSSGGNSTNNNSNNTQTTVSWYNIEIASAIPGQDDPLADQARALEQDYGIEIPDDIRDSFCKLHRLALDNNVSLTALCDYAFGATTSTTTTTSSRSNNSSHSSPLDGSDDEEEEEEEDDQDQRDDGTVTTTDSQSEDEEDEDDDDDDVDRPEEEEEEDGENSEEMPFVLRILEEE